MTLEKFETWIFGVIIIMGLPALIFATQRVTF